MDERAPKTAGIAPAKGGALAVLQFTKPGARSLEERVEEAALTICTYQKPTEQAIKRHAAIAEATSALLVVIVDNCPAGPERSTAISRAREARMWANAGVALEGL